MASRRPLSLAFLFASALSACADGGSPSDVRIERKGSAAVIAAGGARIALPPGDLVADAPPVLRDRAGARLAYPRAGGELRVLYRVGEGIFVGPIVPPPLDFDGVADTEHALGPLFETAGPRRAELVAAVRASMGEEVLARMLASAAYVDDPAWEATAQALSPAAHEVLAAGLVRGLEPGKAPVLFRRAVAAVDLDARPLAPLVDARLRDRKAAAAEPLAFAVLLRAAIRSDPEAASKAACALLPDLPRSPPLLEAATLALVAPGARYCPGVLPVLGGILLAEGCAPWFRCKAGHPLGWGDASTQAEPLCTDAELRSVVDAELARRPQDLFTDRGSSARPGLPAFVFLDEQRDDDLTPVAFHMAHQRRRYAFRDAPAEAPSCDARPALGTPCRCSEAAVRAQACRATLTASTVLLPTAQTGLCRFAIDDGALTLGPVVAAGGMASP